MLQSLCVPSWFLRQPLRRPHFLFLVRLGEDKDILTDPFHLDLFLARINEDIIVRLKWGHTEYKGRLVSVDSYMNIQLSNTEEFVDGKFTGSLGQVLIR